MEAKLEAKLATATQGKGSEGQGTNFRDLEEMELAACLPHPLHSLPKVSCPCCFVFSEKHHLSLLSSYALAKMSKEPEGKTRHGAAFHFQGPPLGS